MNKIKLNMHSHFTNFHIRLKFIATKYKMLLKCLILIKYIILLYFFLIFLISFSDQFVLSMFLYISIVFIILNNHYKTVFLLFFVQKTVFFTRLFINCRK